MKFWNFKGSGDKRAELLLYGDISDSSWWGDEVTPKQFKADLDALGDVAELDIYINSGGGDVFAGFAIYNMLKRHTAKKTVYVDGLAASVASVIAMAGDKIIMPENAMLMIHNAWAVAKGNKAKLRKIADEMDKIDGMLAGIYAARTGKPESGHRCAVGRRNVVYRAGGGGRRACGRGRGEQKIAASIEGDCVTVNGQVIDITRFKDAQKLWDGIPTTVQPPEGGFNA